MYFSREGAGPLQQPDHPRNAGLAADFLADLSRLGWVLFDQPDRLDCRKLFQIGRRTHRHEIEFDESLDELFRVGLGRCRDERVDCRDQFRLLFDGFCFLFAGDASRTRREFGNDITIGHVRDVLLGDDGFEGGDQICSTLIGDAQKCPGQGSIPEFDRNLFRFELQGS